MGFTLAEPSPSLPTRPNTYVRTGRGGAGNMYKPSTSSSSTSPLVPTSTKKSNSSTSSSSSSYFVGGRGGAGNIRPKKDVEPFSFDEELTAVQTRETRNNVWHVGRGGAGNWTRNEEGLQRKNTAASNSSASSSGSARSGILGRISSAIRG